LERSFLDIARLFVQQLAKGLDLATFHRYIANHMTNEFHVMVQFEKRSVSGYRFSDATKGHKSERH
jgi:hypothetical protein